MRTAALILLIACGGDPEPAPDGTPSIDSSMPVVDSFKVPVGAACDASQTLLCDFGFGACFESVCRRQCSSPPTCQPGETMHVYVAEDGGNTCVCLPP